MAFPSRILGAVALCGASAVAVAQQAAPPPPVPPGWADPDQMQFAYMRYEADRKSEGVSVLLELVIPGAGSVYSDNLEGAAITWGCLTGGVVLLVWGLVHADGDEFFDPMPAYAAHSGSDEAGFAIIAGLGLVVGGRIHGFYDAYTATQCYNQRLRQRLGFGRVSLGVTPLATPGGPAWGPVAGWTF